MDGNTSKRTTSELDLPRSSGLSSRYPNHEERSFQFHSRRHNPKKNAQNNNSDKSKYLKPSFQFDGSYRSAASSSKSFSSTRSFRKSYHEQQNLGSLKETDVAESSTRQEENEADNWDFGFHRREEEALEHHKTSIVRGFSTSSTEAPSSSNAASIYEKQINQKCTSAIQDTASSFLHTMRSASRVSKTISPGISDRPQRYALRNIGCASISDVLPSGCSSSNGHHKGDVSVRRKLQYGEGSSNTLLSLREHEVPKEASRRTRPRPGREVIGSVGTKCGFSGGENSRTRQSEQEHERPLSISEVVDKNSERSFSVDQLSACQDFSFAGRPGSSSQRSRNRLIDHSEDRDDYRRFNMEGIAEVLLALEWIGQDELTYEQLMVLEANLFLGALTYDQHREMRMDIDNMSYEELLALEEKMGSVSTALSEDAFSKCLKRSTYRPGFAFPRMPRHGDGDIKCSICQEEYVIGEEVGRLPCEHLYHVECIHQWLRLKNWCPMCTAPAASSKNEPQSY